MTNLVQVTNLEQSDDKSAFLVRLSKAELEAWKSKARENNVSISEYVRLLLREGIAGIKEMEIGNLKQSYERQLKELETSNLHLRQETDDLKNNLILKLSNFFETENNKTEKASVKVMRFKELLGDKEIEVVYTKSGIKERKSYENSLLEYEMNSMNSEKREKVKSIVMKDRDTLVVAIKKVKGECSEEFEEYFKNDLKVLRWHRNA
jgi:hypothetical protein